MAWTIKEAAFTPRGTAGRNAYDQFVLVVQGNPAPVASGGDNALNLVALYTFVASRFSAGVIPGFSPLFNIFDHFEYELVAPISGVWKVTVVYRDPNVTQPTGTANFRGSISGGKQHIVASVNGNTTAYGPNPPTTLGLINAGRAGPPAGEDIDVPVEKFNTVHFVSSSVMQSLINAANSLQGIVNNAAITFSCNGITRTCATHTIKWGGWEYSPRIGFGDWEIVHHWEYRPNKTSITIGQGSNSFTVANKPGWYLLEIAPIATADTGAQATVWAPNYALVHQVYDEDNLSSIIPSGGSAAPWSGGLPGPPIISGLPSGIITQ